MRPRLKGQYTGSNGTDSEHGNLNGCIAPVMGTFGSVHRHGKGKQNNEGD